MTDYRLIGKRPSARILWGGACSLLVRGCARGPDQRWASDGAKHPTAETFAASALMSVTNRKAKTLEEVRTKRMGPAGEDHPTLPGRNGNDLKP